MSQSKAYESVISRSNNPQSHTLVDSAGYQQDNRTIEEIKDENEHLKQYLQKLKQEEQNVERQQVSFNNELPEQFNRRLIMNNEKINQLKTVINEQQDIIRQYNDKFELFESNLKNLMKLDKDIHSKLVNPQHSTTLQKNVKNVLIALNSQVPPIKIQKMIDSIKI